MTYLRNTWYVAALAKEVHIGVLFHRTLLGDSVLMYRKQSGEAVAMRDRCPHRFAPLHKGKLIGDIVECGYHGLQFDCSGTCVRNPHGDQTIPKAAVVRTYPFEERFGFLWIWLGDPDSVDMDLIPDCSFYDGALPTSIGYGYLHAPVHYEIVADNLMDLSHADFVHGPLLHTNGQLTASKATITQQDDGLTIRWDWRQDPPQGFFAPFLPDPAGPARQWVEVGWSPASSMYLHVGAVQNDKSYDDGMVFWSTHIMTPETENSTHYFFAGRRNWLVEDAELNQTFLDATLHAFKTEDLPMVAAVQQEMGRSDLFSLSPVLLSCDAGAIRARRLLSGLLQKESAAEHRIPINPLPSPGS
jgi:phenylpropionate dioxygenase-like ring-hydroxylating dioxygenase large terminal subunit